MTTSPNTPLPVEQIDRDAAQAILDCWFNREEIETILARHRLQPPPAVAQAGEVERLRDALRECADKLHVLVICGRHDKAERACAARAIGMADAALQPTGGDAEREGDKFEQEKRVEWIVNDIAELGVMVGGVAYFLYKGESLIYDDAQHDNGLPMHYRPVFKREFGECAHPIHRTDPTLNGTVSLNDSDEWKQLPKYNATPTPEQAPSGDEV